MAITDEEWNVSRRRGGACNLFGQDDRAVRSDFPERFLKNLDDAYYHFKDDSATVSADGKPRSVIGALEILSWTREMLTGWNPSPAKASL